MKIGYVQTRPLFGKKEKNFEEVRSLLEEKTADLIVLPELFATGYTFTSKEEAQKLAEDKEGKTARFLKEISQKTNAVIVAGFAEKNRGKIYNASILVFKDEVIATYKKLHLYYKEKLWFSPGDRPLKVYKVKGMNIGMMVCFDWFFPEVARSLALKGAQIIAHPANLVLPYCQMAMKTRSLENRVFAVTANRIGREQRGEDDFTFTGGSQITSFNSKVLSSAPEDKIVLDFVEVDIDQARSKELNRFNDLFRDRREKYYY
ncbi:MAG: Nitrilase [Promethearchaeota archaeon]|nr:MAG: Nitrilase [Candidatus Lokiarchaeota archaeon]